MVVGGANDGVAVIPRDDSVGRRVQRATQPHRVALGDVTIAQLRRELERRRRNPPTRQRHLVLRPHHHHTHTHTHTFNGPLSGTTRG